VSVYVPSYKNAFSRFLYSFFIQMPLTLWFKYISYPLPQNVLEADYDVLWAKARGAIATAPFPTTSSANSPMHAADPRALSLQAVGVTVISVPDEPIANLVKVNPAWAKDKDPSGAILQLSGLTYSPDHAFTLCGKHSRVYAATSQIPAVLQYEFENIVLDRLGYSVLDR
jgi:hypothetical protein